LGASTTPQKVYESVVALDDGAVEISLVLDSAVLRAGNKQLVRAEILAVAQVLARDPRAVLKVVVDTASIEGNGLRTAAHLAIEGGAHYVVALRSSGERVPSPTKTALRRSDDTTPALTSTALRSSGDTTLSPVNTALRRSGDTTPSASDIALLSEAAGTAIGVMAMGVDNAMEAKVLIAAGASRIGSDDPSALLVAGI